ncbi:MAG: argininosuccinate lyase [archaeon]
MKLWDKGYDINREVEMFTVGNDYLLDRKLVKHDCRASIAHAEMLKEAGILNEEELARIVEALNGIIAMDLEIMPEDEDCHTAIENQLTKTLGDLGRKIHTARSRNDQVVAALRLYADEQQKDIIALCDEFTKTLDRLDDCEIPGYTHTRKAMPSSVAMWAGGFADSMRDNAALMEHVRKRVFQSPIGGGAGYGVPLDIDRALPARILGFSKVQNPVYVQNSRGKFEADVLHCCSQVMLDLNKMASDLILFTMPEFGYFQLPDEFCTGSSIMPHKKNPDVLELVRAKYHVVSSYEQQVKGIVSNLISGYHRDLQLTKEPLMSGLGVTRDCLQIMTSVVKNLRIDRGKAKKACTAELYATKEVYELVKQGIPFREAYRKVSGKY